MSKWLAVAALLLAFVLGVVASLRFRTGHEEKTPDTPAVVAKVREVARLESLDVSLYKKIDFSPDPRAQDSLWSSLSQWAQYAMRAPRGRAIVFAVAHLSVDLRRLDDSAMQVSGRTVEVVLPRVQTQVELLPAETEIIGSNLDSAQTAELFERAKAAFQAQVAADVGLQDRARTSAQWALRSIFSGLGFQEVKFVDKLSSAKHG
jgi:hypothetical protein